MRTGALALVVILTACNGTTSSIRARFATETGCPESTVTVVESGATRYRATGCGESTTYVCESPTMSVTDTRRCVRDDERQPRRPADRDAPPLPPPDPRVRMP